MDDHGFERIVREAFRPFLKELGFSVDSESISGRLYLTTFTSRTNAVSVAYEPGEPGDQAPIVRIYSVDRGQRSDIDDPSKTPRLSDLNARYMKSESRPARYDPNPASKQSAANESLNGS